MILALDGVQGHEVLWVLRDVVAGEPLLARSLLGATADDLAPVLEEARIALTGERPEDAIPIRGVISDGQVSIRHAVAPALPGVPHQLCQFHSLRAAATPLFEADRHAQKELKKQVRGVRPIERSLEGQRDPHAEAARSDCLAARSLTTGAPRWPHQASSSTGGAKRSPTRSTGWSGRPKGWRAHPAIPTGRGAEQAARPAAVSAAPRLGDDGIAVAADPDRLRPRPPRGASARQP